MAVIDVLTNRYDSSRTGANMNETVLNQKNVNVNTFGKLFARNVDGQIYAQPLIVSHLSIKGAAPQNVAFVATTRNNLYAFNADDPALGNPLWPPRNFGTPVPASDYDNLDKQGLYKDFTGEIGITATPVIDRASGTLYLTSKSKENGVYFCRLHAVRIDSGVDARAPTDINATVPGTGTAASVAKRIKFDPKMHLNRPGLLLLGGVIYIAFGSQGDREPYHGWVFAYDAATFRQLGVYCTTPNWGEGGIWQSGCGLAGDTQGEIFGVMGNGDFQNQFAATPNFSSGPFFGMSVLRLTLDQQKETLNLADWFTPFNAEQLNQQDMDLCAGPVLLPWASLVGAWGKDRAYYIMNRNKMGHFTAGANQIAQFAPNMTSAQPQNVGHPHGATGHIHGAPVMFDHPTLGPISYVWGENDDLRGYRFDKQTSKFETQLSPNLISAVAVPVGMPGAMLTASGDGANAASCIVWASHPDDADANAGTVAGVLQAFAADDLRQPLWRSNHDPLGADDVGNFAKFCPPVVANGKVYLATFSSELVVYGLLPGGVPQPTLGEFEQSDVPVLPANSNVFQVEGSASLSCNRFTILGSGHDIWDPADAFHFVFKKIQSNSTTITARVVSVTDTSPWAKAGVMIRASLDAVSAHAIVVVTPEMGVALQFRPATGANMTHVPANVAINPAKPSAWVRLARVAQGGGFSFTGFVSLDGITWQQIGEPVQITMTAAALAGMAVTAHNDPPSAKDRLDELCVALIDNVRVQ
jgi:hypothetical protein